MCVVGSSHACVCKGAVIHVCVREQSYMCVLGSSHVC
jgi:hypothetical protein